ncbi:MAG TPA: hypothetical protein DCR28_04425 [Eubacterium sp.]|nr:hypothetical protein [Eubacterium sp.]
MYKRIVSYIIAIALVITGITFVPMSKKVLAVADPSDSGWTLQWSDEFDGNSLNTNTWTYETGTGQNGWGNNELQYYTNRTDNVYVTGGNLNIKAKRESYNGSNFTSGRIISKNKKYFKYGKMEARIKVDGGNQNGVWPAFWMMGNDIDQVGWPACGELDIMEHANSNPYIGGTIHWGTDWQNHTYWGSGNENTDKYYTDNTNNGINGWHTYGVTWDESTIKWYMDNEVYFLANIGPGYNANGYFQKDAFFLLNLAIGGPATGYTNNKGPDDSFQSATMQVDYVRAYKYNGSQPETLYPSGYTEANRGGITSVGAWSYFFGDDSWGQCKTAYKGGTNLNDFSVYFMKKATTDWGAQIRPNLSLDANTKYNYSFTVDTDAGGNNFLVKYENSGTDKILHNEALTSGTKTYTGTFTTGDSTEGRVCFNLWEIASGKTFTVKNFSVWKDGTTTQAPTTQAPTTKAPSGELVANTDVPVDAWGQFGNYYVYTGTWDGNNTAKAGVDPNNANHIVVNKTNTVYNSAWLTQVKLELPNIPANTDYTYEWPIKAANSDGTVCSSDANDGDNNQTALTGANQTLTGHVEVSGDVACVVVGMGWVNPSNPIEFFEPTIKDKNGNVVYPTQAPTTKTPTTARPTTTQRPTQAPTTKAPTQRPTQSPTNEGVTTKVPDTMTIGAVQTNASVTKKTPTTTKKPSAKVYVGKAKVKKAKKKSVKKIKVKLKKVKGATGYQVKAYKSKKKAKKNKKAIAKKVVKKVKFTFKSKKFRNKKKIYLRARAFVVKGQTKVYGAWSKPKKVKIKK